MGLPQREISHEKRREGRKREEKRTQFFRSIIRNRCRKRQETDPVAQLRVSQVDWKESCNQVFFLRDRVFLRRFRSAVFARFTWRRYVGIKVDGAQPSEWRHYPYSRRRREKTRVSEHKIERARRLDRCVLSADIPLRSNKAWKDHKKKKNTLHVQLNRKWRLLPYREARVKKDSITLICRGICVTFTSQSFSNTQSRNSNQSGNPPNCPQRDGSVFFLLNCRAIFFSSGRAIEISDTETRGGGMMFYAYNRC